MLRPGVCLLAGIGLGGCTGGLMLETAGHKEILDTESMMPVEVWRRSEPQALWVCFQDTERRSHPLEQGRDYNWRAVREGASPGCPVDDVASVDWRTSNSGALLIPGEKGETRIREDVRRPWLWLYPLVPLGYAADLVAWPFIMASWLFEDE